jgi:hypothetical protein
LDIFSETRTSCSSSSSLELESELFSQANLLPKLGRYKSCL